MTTKDREPERVQKILARAGLASRRAAEELILDGRVTRNGAVVVLGDRATPGEDVIEVDGIALEPVPEPRYFALNKPAGVVSTASDPQGRRTVLDLLDDELTGGRRVFPVGRLDMDSSGLILLTNDGFLAHRLMHPKFGVAREYLLEVKPVPRREDLARLRKGVVLEDGDTGPARVSLLGEQAGRAQINMVIHAGKKRQIRRTFDHLGYKVLVLNRVRIGSLGL
ncbi:MAG: pseudouridine synthase, partial [Candidatus Geothermincolia bacterium]